MAAPGSTDRLLALGAAFAARLATDATRLRELAAQLDSTSADECAQAIEELRSLAHRLHGTAPAFDAADIGESAGTLESAIVAGSRETTEWAAGVREQLRALLALLDTALGAHGPPRQFRPRL